MIIYTIVRYIVWFIYKVYYKISFEGLENIPQDKSCVYASNHRSYADPVFITIPVKKRFAYMAKEELFKGNKFFKFIIEMMGAFPVVRGSGDMSVITTSVEKLESGRNLVIFPEGTRSKDGKVGKGKTGVAMIAAKSGRDVVPVGIVYEGELKFRKKVTVKFGEPISAEKLHISEDASPKELKVIKKEIMDAITTLVEG